MFSYNNHQSTENSSLFWNGSAWVPPSTLSTPNFAPTTEPSTAQAIPPHPIATYTDYYHKWMEKCSEQETLIASTTIRSPQDREDMQRQLQWYQYYADQSSRAAHYFYSIGEETATRAPFDLPPEPPQYAVLKTPATTKTQQVQQQYTQTTTVKQSSAASCAASVVSFSPSRAPSEDRSTSAPPDTLKLYVDRCLSQYEDPKDKTKVMEIVAETISSSVKNGTMKSINWDSVPLIQLETNDSTRLNLRRSQSRSRSISCSTNNSAGRRRGTRGRGRRFSRRSNSSTRGDDNSTLTSSTNKRSHDQQTAPHNRFSSSFNKRTPSFANLHSLAPLTTTNEDCSSRSNKRQCRIDSKSWVPQVSTAPKEINSDLTVKGTSQTLEKNYLRLTAAPEAELVRPQPILEQHFTNLKDAMRASSSSFSSQSSSSGSQQTRNYNWFCSQLKAIRQDLTVQHLHKSPFAVDVYETHARIALRESDLNEFNQCQTQLQELYPLFDNSENQDVVKNRNEFVVYGILYFVLLSVKNKDSFDLSNMLQSLSYTQRQDASIQYALALHDAVTHMNYYRIFSMIKSAPYASHSLINKIAAHCKKESKTIIGKAYKSEDAFELSENYNLSNVNILVQS